MSDAQRAGSIRAELNRIVPVPTPDDATAAGLARWFAAGNQEAMARFRRLVANGRETDPLAGMLSSLMSARFAAAVALQALDEAADADEVASKIIETWDLGETAEWTAAMLGADQAAVWPLAADLAEVLDGEPEARMPAGEPPLPDGEYARVEILGHDSHTGWVTDATRAGVPVMVVRDWDGRVIAEIPGTSLYRFVPLATPLKRPVTRAMLPPGRGGFDPEYEIGDTDDDDPDELVTLVITQAAMIPLDRSPADLLSWVLWDEHGDPIPSPVYEHPAAARSVTGREWHRFEFHPVQDPDSLQPCGTYAAYSRHVAHDDPIDDACEAAARRYWAARKRAQREARIARGAA